MPIRDGDATNLIGSGVLKEDTTAEPKFDRVIDDDRWLAPVEGAPKRTVEQRFGQAVLRLRLYRGWTQRDVQRSSGVHQSQISRLETGRQHGLSSRRIFAILLALHVDEIAFLPPPAAPQTALEIMLRGDPWERAGRAAERRLSRRRSA
jgi:transcriptional regulator with XRE-family HTH domain